MTRAEPVLIDADGLKLTAGGQIGAKRRKAGGISSGVSLTVIASALAAGGGGLIGDPAAHAQTLTGQQSTTITLSGKPLVVDTAPAFGVAVEGDSAIVLNGTDGTAFTDANSSIIIGDPYGISGHNNGSGALSIVTNGTVTGGVIGIAGSNTVDGSNVTIRAATVSGGNYGIHAVNSGSQALSVTTTGAVNSSNGKGIYARNGSVKTISFPGYYYDYSYNIYLGTNLTISTSAVTGSTGGIVANNTGYGELSITSSGTVSGGSGYGIQASNSARGTNLTISTSAVTGSTGGIAANNSGYGELSITSSGIVSSETGNAIQASNSVRGADLTISTAAVSGGSNGIYAQNSGSGDVTITSTGTVIGSGGRGISAVGGVSGKALTINAAAVSGTKDGIAASNLGSGALAVTASGTVSGTSGRGIYGYTRGSSLTVSAASVSGGTGISVRNYGTGALSVTATGTVTGTNGYGIAASNLEHATSLTLNTAAVSSDQSGIFASNRGTGALSITSTGAVSGTAKQGIYARNSIYGTGLSVSAAAVSGGEGGIYARNSGMGDLSIAATGAVTGGTGEGITARNDGKGTGLTINAAAVTGTGRGIDARNYGTGALSVTTTGLVTGDTTLGRATGIYASNYSGTNLTVSAAAVTGADNGIGAYNRGTGSTSVTATGKVTGTNGTGIRASASSSAGDFTISTVDVSGGHTGIYARNYGGGALSVSSTGTVAGTRGRGIYAQNFGNATDLNVLAATVTGGTSGIEAVNGGSGDLTITATGTVTGQDGVGISARNNYVSVITTASVAETTGKISISTAAVSGYETGIQVQNIRGGGITIASTGDVVGSQYEGIAVYNRYSSTSTNGVSISTAKVTGGYGGISAANGDLGALSITSTGPVEATNGRGIQAYNFRRGTDLTVNVGAVSGHYGGIATYNGGSGALSVTSTGPVTADYGTGIRANSGYRGTTLTISTAAVSGQYSGISTYHGGSGALTVTATGPVAGGLGDGVYIRNRGSSATLSVGEVTGEYFGIRAQNSGGGALSITSAGTVTGNQYNGIVAVNGFVRKGRGPSVSTLEAAAPVLAENRLGTDLTIASAAVSGGTDGIYALNNGTGALSIATTGAVTGSNGRGIFAANGGVEVTTYDGDDRGLVSAASIGPAAPVAPVPPTSTTYTTYAGTSLTVSTAAAVTGATDGIYARNFGTGALSITSSGPVVGEDGNGIIARNAATATNLSISAAAVTGVTSGIAVQNDGTGALSVAATGTVTGQVDGIMARNSGSGTDMTVSTAAVSGGRKGIAAFSSGTGALSVTSSGTVTGGTDAGIYATQSIKGTGLSISAASVSGGTFGIFARNDGAGAIAISSTGTVTSASFDGISASNSFNAGGVGGIAISTAIVTGNYDGISASNQGKGALSITSTGPVTGVLDRGIVAGNSPQGTDLTIKVGSVSGGQEGIDSYNAGSGVTSITATGDVTSKNRTGLRAFSGSQAKSLTITAGSVSGATNGIDARNGGAGTLSIAASGPIIGTKDSGVLVRHYGSDATLRVAEVTGGTDGIRAQNAGTGGLSITSTAAVSGAAGSGILAENAATATNLTIVSAAVSGGVDGINALNNGTGALSITSAAAVSGKSGSGIVAENGKTGSGLTIVAADVAGATDGIKALNNGSGALAVTVAGAVKGGSGAGISTQSSAGSAVAINLKSTSNVSAASGAAIVDGAGNATVTIDSGAVITGSIALGEGNDTLTIGSGISLAGVTMLDGGAGAFTDTLNLNTQFAGSVSSWEVVNADTSAGNFALSGGISGAMAFNKKGTGTLTISGTNSLTGPTIVSGGRLNVLGSLGNSAVTLQNGTTIGGTGTVGSLTAMAGSTIAPGNSIGTLHVNGDLTLQAGSTLSMEISPMSVDMIEVTGAATIAGNLVVIPEAGSYFARTYTLINASSVKGTFDASTYGVLGTAFRPTLVYTATSVNLRLDPNSLVVIGGGALTGNSLALAQSFDKAVLGGYNPQPFFDLYVQGANLAAVLPQFTGELHSAERRVTLQGSRVVRETAFDRLNSDFGETPDTSSVTTEDGGNAKTLWMRVAGNWGRAKADGIGGRFTTDEAGFLIGADYANDTGFKLGGMFNYLKTDLNTAALGNSKIETFGGAFYAGYRQDASGLALGAGWGMAHNTAKSTRAISVPGLAQTLRGTTNGTSYQVFAEAAYDLATAPDTRVEPFARIAYAVLDSKALAETGGIAALRAGKQSNDLTLSTFGLRGGYVTGRTTLTGSAGWQRTTGDRSAPTSLTMAGLNTPFVVQSTALDRDALAVEAAANVSVSARFNLSLGYSGLIGKKSKDHGARATARFEF